MMGQISSLEDALKKRQCLQPLHSSNLDHLYRNYLKNRFSAASDLPENSCSRSCLGHRQWSLAVNKNSQDPPCQNSDSSNNFGIDDDTKKILSQPFHYLGRGRQCFAFASEDGKYVLKCIRTDKFKAPFWTHIFPNILKKKQSKIEQKKYLVFESFRMANEELKD